MVGLNHEMARQLLFNNYPTDQRGSYFRQFWDVSAYVRQSGDPADPAALAELLKDIPAINTWPKNTRLGDNENRKDVVENNLVLVIRGELLKRYPNTIIFAGKAVFDVPNLNNELHLDESPGAEQSYKHPIFMASFPPDITVIGFNLTASEALGEQPDAPNGYFLASNKYPTEPRFGLEPSQTLSPVPYWSELSWANFAETGFVIAATSMGVSTPQSLPNFVGGFSASRLPSSVFRLTLASMTIPNFIPATKQPNDVSILHPGDNPANDLDSGIQWGKDSAQAAYILLRRPFRIMVHASRMMRHV